MFTIKTMTFGELMTMGEEHVMKHTYLNGMNLIYDYGDYHFIAAHRGYKRPNERIGTNRSNYSFYVWDTSSEGGHYWRSPTEAEKKFLSVILFPEVVR